MIRNNLHKISLLESFKISKNKFEELFNGSAILRLGYERWLRNVAIGLGNAKKSKAIVSALKKRLPNTSPMVQEHINWAIKQQSRKN
jgi:epoxyqueuosine reductase